MLSQLDVTLFQIVLEPQRN